MCGLCLVTDIYNPTWFASWRDCELEFLHCIYTIMDLEGFGIYWCYCRNCYLDKASWIQVIFFLVFFNHLCKQTNTVKKLNFIHYIINTVYSIRLSIGGISFVCNFVNKTFKKPCVCLRTVLHHYNNDVLIKNM